MEASCRRVSTGEFSGGTQGGAWDHGIIVQLSSGRLVMARGTDNATVTDQVFISDDYGVTWTLETHGSTLPAANANGGGLLSGDVVVWGGKHIDGTIYKNSYRRTAPGVWAQISSDMGAVYGSTREQFAFARTAANFLTIGGDNTNNTVASPSLATDSWADQGNLPSALQNTGGMYADYCIERDEVWLVGGYNNNSSTYQDGLWMSNDEGQTWTLMLQDSIFATKWPNLICCNWGIIYIAGSTGSNVKGGYMIDYDTLEIKRFALEPSARHACFTCHSYDGEEGFLATGNFVNDAYRFVRTDVLPA